MTNKKHKSRSVLSIVGLAVGRLLLTVAIWGLILPFLAIFDCVAVTKHYLCLPIVVGYITLAILLIALILGLLGYMMTRKIAKWRGQPMYQVDKILAGAWGILLSLNLTLEAFFLIRYWLELY